MISQLTQVRTMTLEDRLTAEQVELLRNFLRDNKEDIQELFAEDADEEK